MINIRKYMIRSLAAAALGLGMASCYSDDLEMPATDSEYSPEAQLVINLAVPESLESAATRAEETPAADECKINSLRLIAFSSNGTSVVNRPLLAPSEMPVSPQRTAIYEIKDLRPGDYKIFVVANLENYVADVESESELRKIIMDLDGERSLKAGNLPMVYDPGDALLTVPDASAPEPAVTTLSMQFACVKVRYNILFDNSTFGKDMFGSNGMVIKKVTASNVSKRSYLLYNADAAPFESRSAGLTGAHFGAYTENQANASKNDADVITVSGNGSARPSAPGKWAWQGTAYFPERYARNAGEQTTMNIEATVTDAQGNDGRVNCRYKIRLGESDGDKSIALPRGAYYEVIAKVKTLGDSELDAQMVKKDWMSTVIGADMVHTYLKLSKTRASVTSLEDDFLSYDTDGRGDVKFECVTKLPVGGSTAAIIPIFDTANKKITFRPNPAVTISSLPENQRKGTAQCYVTAGNIRKLVSVDYDITPFFEITPLDLKIQWGTSYDTGLNVKVYEYRTNLGGIDIAKLGSVTDATGSGTVYIGGNSQSKSYTDQIAKSRISLSCTDPRQATGQIKVTLLANPEFTQTHHFTAAPREGASGTGYSRTDLCKEVTVTTMPPLGPYRIYFRAINDWVHYNGGQSISEFLHGNYSNYPTEDYNAYTSNSVQSNNWCDWWHEDHYKGIYDADHRIYIYTQIGETTGSSRPGAWLFTGDYVNSGTHMTGDNTNPGWYYYDLEADRKSSWNAGSQKTPEPGKTLMIFYAHKATVSNDGTYYGYEPHRASHHNDPGISLFDFEDREGYVLYDPTSEPYYRIFDQKPYIEDVTYTVYSTSKINKWWNRYGVAENSVSFDNPAQWQIEYTIRNSDYSTTTIGGRTWYVTRIKLKAPRGDYEKAIKLDGLTASTPADNTKYVYYCANGNNPYNPPCAYFWGGSNGKEYTTWVNAPAMTRCGSLSGSPLYRIAIPAGWENGKVILKRQGDLNGDANQTVERQLNGKSVINYGDNRTYWAEYGNSGSQQQSGVMLFGGRSFAGYNHTGYYLNGKWYGGVPK